MSTLNYLANKKKPESSDSGFLVKSLAIPYFYMATCHTIIGAKRFHCRVRDGIGWATLAMFTKQTGQIGFFSLSPTSSLEICTLFLLLVLSLQAKCLSDFILPHKPIGCYMVKPHGQLVLVSFIHY